MRTATCLDSRVVIDAAIAASHDAFARMDA
jgi:hypothetical protein